MTDLDLCRRAAEAYAPYPAGVTFTAGDLLATLHGDGVLAIRGTANWRNWVRDFDDKMASAIEHPELGRCDEGALRGAEALDAVTTQGVTLTAVTGHSLGGQIALILAAMRNIPLVVSWDAPKAGEAGLAVALAGATVRQYRFRDSSVTRWPLFHGCHMRTPLIDIGDKTWAVVEAHSIDRALAWMERNQG